MQKPNFARARPSTLLEDDESYSKLFHKNNDLQAYYLVALLGRGIEEDLKKVGINDKRIMFLPNTVDTKKIKDIYNLNKNTSDKQLKLITVARYAEKKKGYDLLPILAQKLLKNNINFRWTIIGENTNKLLENDFVKKNKNLFNIFENIDNDVEKYFPHSSIINKYISSDIYVNLARIESFEITGKPLAIASIKVIPNDSILAKFT